MEPIKKCLLTDFNDEYWQNITDKCLRTEVKRLNVKNHSLYGQMKERIKTDDILLSKASHIIANLTLLNRKIYGDVAILRNKNGKKAIRKIRLNELVDNNKELRFELRSRRINNNIEIFTWDICF